MSKPSFKVVLKDKTVAIVESAGGVYIGSSFDNMLAFNDKESGEVVAIFPVGTFTHIQMCGAVSINDIKGLEEMGQDSKSCHQEDTTGNRKYRALYHAQKKKADSLSCEVEGLESQVAALKTELAAKDCEIRALKSNDRPWVGAPLERQYPIAAPYYSLQAGDGVLPIHFKVMS